MSIQLNENNEHSYSRLENNTNCLTKIYNCLSLNSGRILSCLSLPFFCCGPTIVINQGYKGILTRFGIFREVLNPGRYAYNMCTDNILKVCLKTQVMNIDTLQVMTSDNLSVSVDAVCFFNILDAYKSVFNVENLNNAIKNLSKAVLRAVIGENDLKELFSNRTTINNRITELIKNTAIEWGVGNIELEIKDVSIPDDLKRIMAKTAESKQEAESKLIVAEGEKIANEIILQTANSLKNNPEAMELVWFNTLKTISVEKSTTIIVPDSILAKFKSLL